MDERLRHVARLLDGGKMAVLCRELEISHKTGYRIYRGYRDNGLVDTRVHDTARSEELGQSHDRRASRQRFRCQR